MYFSGRVIELDYLRFIPAHLCDQARDFVSYATEAPYTRPTQCSFCQSPRFFIYSRKNLTRYMCSKCKRIFSPLTGTVLSGFQFHDEWGIQAKCILTGISMTHFCQITKRDIASLRRRERILAKLMQQLYPALYQWWHGFYYYKERIQKPQKLIYQAKKFRNWLKEHTMPTQVICPECGSTECRLFSGVKNGVNYRCGFCNLVFSLIADTRFRKTEKVDELLPVFKMLMAGYCDTDISRERGILSGSVTTPMMWRQKMLAQIRDLNLDLLADWIEWRHYTRFRAHMQQDK